MSTTSSGHRTMMFVATVMLLMLFPALAASAEKGPTGRRIVVQDMLGRKVSVPANPRRIIALAGALRMVVYLNAFDRVVGVEGIEKESPAPTGRPYGTAINRKAAALPDVGEGGLKPVNIEKIITLRPDVIFAAGFDRFQAEDMTRKTGVPVVALTYGGTGILSDDRALRSLSLLGSILGEDKRARDITTYITVIREDLSRRTRGIAPGNPRVYVGCIAYKGIHGITSTDAEFFPLDALGASNVAKGLRKSGHLFIDREQILVWDPDVILIDVAGMALLRKDFAEHPVFYRKLKAVREGRVFQVMPYNNYYTNIETALADAYAAGVYLFPKRFTGIDPDRKAAEIIRFFTGAAAYDSMKQEFGGFRRLDFSGRGIRVR
ncbi:MAG: ABC transporter substrate-binding protein [Geobacteraceae bacterium]|nr:ABC transporter substrate-binding protein [Geobacteraceae bacterium]